MLWGKTENTFQKNFWCSDDKMHRLPFLALLFVPPGADLKKNKENSAFLRKSGRIFCFPSTRPGHRHSLQPQRWKILKHRCQGENPFNIHFSWRTEFMTMLISSLLPRPPILFWKWPSTADLVPQLADGSDQIQIGLFCPRKIWNLEYWLCPLLIANLWTNHNIDALLPGIVVFQPRFRGSSFLSINSQSARHVCPKTQSRA